jgi:suppressor for copper-sensitivity B
MLAVVGTLWTGRWVVGERRFIRPALVGGLALAAFLAPSQIPSREIGGPAVTATEGLWRPFDEARIPVLLRESKIVFVDVTADWCITCQVNKRLVLDIGEVAKDLAVDDVVAMRADWTRPSDDIARYLASFGRYGIPFNVIYGPGAPSGVVLPELLTESAVLDAFAKARGVAPTPIAQTSQAAPGGP